MQATPSRSPGGGFWPQFFGFLVRMWNAWCLSVLRCELYLQAGGKGIHLPMVLPLPPHRVIWTEDQGRQVQATTKKKFCKVLYMYVSYHDSSPQFKLSALSAYAEVWVTVAAPAWSVSHSHIPSLMFNVSLTDVHKARSTQVLTRTAVRMSSFSDQLPLCLISSTPFWSAWSK